MLDQSKKEIIQALHIALLTVLCITDLVTVSASIAFLVLKLVKVTVIVR